MRASTAMPAALALALALALTGCGLLGDDPGSSSAASARPATPAPGYGAVFLDKDECSSGSARDFGEVPCYSEKAAARVVARHDGPSANGPRCPDNTDFVLHISESSPSADEDGDGVVPQGYACMRNLEPPHPGDPGGGGGPLTIAGDCVYRTQQGGPGEQGQVKETPCDSSGAHPPQFRITRVVERRGQCPGATALYVEVGGARPVGCAERVR